MNSTFFKKKSFNKYNFDHDYIGKNAAQKVRYSNLLNLLWL